MLEESIWSGHQRSGHQLVLCSVWASIRRSLSCLSRSTILIDFHEPSTVSKSAICCQTASTSRAVWSCSTTTQFLCLSTCKAKSAGQPLVLEADNMKEGPIKGGGCSRCCWFHGNTLRLSISDKREVLPAACPTWLADGCFMIPNSGDWRKPSQSGLRKIQLFSESIALSTSYTLRLFWSMAHAIKVQRCLLWRPFSQVKNASWSSNWRSNRIL